MIIKTKKRLIKIIRRSDTKAISDEHGTHVIMPTRPDNEREARVKLRKADSTVLGWIAERRENSRIEQIAALEILDGKVLLAGQ